MSNYTNTPILELAAIVANHLRQYDIQVVLVGGLAVEIYTENLYLTKDIDMVNTSYDPPAAINQAMAAIGFCKQGRVYVNDTTDICVEFPTAPLSVGAELIHETTIVEFGSGEIPILLAKDVIKDRLVAYFHWNDRPSLVQALALMSNHTISTEELKTFCLAEGKTNQYEIIEGLWRTVQQKELLTMEAIEALVIAQAVQEI
jgi:hypothetical protein